MVTLESSKLFGQLPPGELRELQKVAKEMRFAKGQSIFKQGDPGDGVYVVKSGAVQISTLLGTGERLVFAEVMPGDVFGEMSLLDHHPRSAYAGAKSDTTLYFIPRSDLLEMLRRSPDLSLMLVQQTSERLRESNQHYIQKMLHAERMGLVGRFASSIVHDLKNPLTIISMAAEGACAEEASAETRRTAADRIFRQVDRITSLVNDILEFTRGTPGAFPLSVVDFGEFVRSKVEEMQSELSLKSVALEFENPPPRVPIALHPHRIARVLCNLVLNAVDAMPEGGKITLRFHETADGITTEVEDTGPGIAPEVLDRLFEAFVTFGKSRGTGLGLAICQKIIGEHEGKITARNQPGGGAVFAFFLPRK